MTQPPDPSISRPTDLTGLAWAYASRYDDIDAQAAHFRGFGQHYEQLGRGRFVGQFQSFSFGHELTIHLEYANRELVQSAVTPPGRVGLSVIAAQSPACVLNAATVGPSDVILYPAGKTIEGRTPEGMQIFCIDMDARLFADDASFASSVRIVHNAPRAGALREVVSTGIAAFRTLGSPVQHPAAKSDFTSSVAELAWLLAHSSTNGPEHIRRRARARALLTYNRARELFVEELERGISIAQVCKVIGVSRRSLECSFRSVVGVSPAHYVRKLQLNCIRRDLLCSVDPATPIGEIAARYGVWHWSRCSQEYRHLFGELPSETRRRMLSGTA